MRYTSVRYFSLLACFSSFVGYAYANTVPLAGQFKVNEQGAATYTLPIESPTARGGLRPGIALTYSSSGGDGYLGQGWSLSASSVISRCPQSFAQDGLLKGVNLSMDDKFCLDGMRLVLVSGVYGEADSEYRKEIDDASFITALGQTSGGGPAAFQVETKAGETHYFGNISAHSNKQFNNVDGNNITGDSAITIDTENGEVTRLWALKAIEDNVGNYISYHYTQTASEQMLSSIDYAGHSDGTAPYVSVKFHYMTNPKPKSGYVYGAEFSLTKLLNRIEVELDGQHQKSYFLDYSTSNKVEDKNFIDSIQACVDVDRNDCTRAIAFDWTRRPFNNWSFTPFVASASHTMPIGENLTSQMFDMDGDGFTDIIYVRSGAWYKRTLATGDEERLTGFGSNKAHFAQSIDFNGDGQRDLLIATSETSNWHVISFKPSIVTTPSCEPNGGGTHLCEDVDRVVAYTLTDLKRKALGYDGSTLVVDVNGDALEDILFLKSGQIQWYKNLGGRFDVARTLYTFSSQDTAYFEPDVIESAPSFKTSAAVDVNGDGLTDLLLKVRSQFNYCSTGGGLIYDVSYGECVGDLQGQWRSYDSTDWQLFVSNGARFIKRQNIPTTKDVKHLRVADLNGDGLTDIVYVQNGTWRQRLSNGVHFLGETNIGVNSSDSLAKGTYFLDVNGDGRADMLHPVTTSEAIRVRLSKPAIRVDTVDWEDRGHFLLPSGSRETIRFADTLGDGRTSLYYAENNRWRINRPVVSAHNNTIHAITDGFGVKTNITYDHVTRKGAESVYKTQVSSNLDSSKNFSTIPPLRVVKRVQTETGPNSSVGVKFEYGGLLVNRLGRGFQGFELLRSIDEQSGVVTETQYAQLFPATGLPLATKQHYQGNSLSLSTNHYTFVEVESNEHNKIYRRTEMETVDISRQYGSDDVVRELIRTETHNEYDEWGNLTQSTAEKHDLSSTGISNRIITTNLYDGAGGGAQKGRLSSSVVSSSRWGEGDAPTITKRSSFSYYSNGLLKTSILSPDIPRYRLTTTNHYDRFGNTTRVDITGGTQASGAAAQTRSTHTAYDARGRFVHSATNGAGDVAISQYNQQSANSVTGRITSAAVTDANGRKITKYFDIWGRVIREVNPDATQITYRYELCSQSDCTPLVNGVMLTTKNQLGSPTEQVITDKYGREVGSKVKGFNGDWIVTAKSYDKKGRMSRQYEPAFDSVSSYYSQLSYDDFNRVISERMPNDSVSTRYYQGLETLYQDGMGKQQTKQVNIFGEQSKVIDELYNELSFEYDATGNLLRSYVQSSGGQKVLRTSLEYDQHGRKTTSRDLDKGLWRYTYNAFGELLTQTNASGQVTTLFYDALGRKIRRTELEGTSCWLYGNRATKNAGMLVTERIFGSQTTNCNAGGYLQQKTLGYDNYGRLDTTTTHIGADAYITQFTYDAAGRIDTLRYPKNLVAIENRYNDAGYLFQRKDKTTGLVYQTVSNMNARGQVTEVNYGNGAQESTSYQSDTGWIDTIQLNKGGLLHQLAYRFDEMGNLDWRQHQLTSAPATFAENYTYDDLYRLYDRTITVSSGGSTLPVDFKSTQNIRYDDWGNIVSKTGTGHYRYDATNPYKLLGISQTPAITAAIKSCPVGYSLNAATSACVKAESRSATAVCASGYSWNGSSCQKTVSTSAIVVCSAGYNYSSTSNKCVDVLVKRPLWVCSGGGGGDPKSVQQRGCNWKCPSGYQLIGYDSHCEKTVYANVTYSCPSGATLSGSTCSTKFNKPNTWRCPSGTTLSGTQCQQILTQIPSGWSCPAGWSLTGTNCNRTLTASVIKSCPAGTTLNGSNCISQTSSTHAMTYDARGNITSDSQRNFNYTSYDLIDTITQGRESSSFEYDAGRARYKRADIKIEAGVNAYYTTYYVGSHYEKVMRTGGGKAALTEQKYYVGNVVITKRSNNTTDTFYLHKDHQGSTTTVTNAAGIVVQQFTYDPWGKQTAAYSNSRLNGVISPSASKGYTGHEGIDHMDIIHMNGRIYDANIGRFLQADPFIQQADNLQNYNRYAYVLNNPMSYSDPTGFFFDKIWKAIKKYWKPILAIVVAVVTYGAASEWAFYQLGMVTSASSGVGLSAVTTYSLSAGGYALAGAAAGAVAGGITTGSLSGAAKGALTGAIMGGVTGALSSTGTSFSDSAYRLSLSAVGGCTAGAVSGGSCGEGAKLAVIAQGLKITMDSYSGYESSLKTSKGNAVIKLEGDGVQNSSVSNTGTSVEVELGSLAAQKGLVGRDISTLNAQEIQMLKASLVNKGTMDFYSWSAAQNRVEFNSFNHNYWMSEYSPVLSLTSRGGVGVRAFSVFHDKWMANWDISSTGVLI
ncbi:FG-GAP-like repeat-containing protein, partial [Shewanella sp. E94]